MLADWSAECSHDAPTLVVPWRDPNGTAQFYDLRAEPFDIAEIPEAEQFPALGRALRALNATRSPFVTAKCDAWALTEADEDNAATLETLRLELCLDEELSHFGFGCYVDLIFRERSIFVSRHHLQARLDGLVRRAQKLPHDHAAIELVLRPALLDFGMPLEGFATTLYVTAVGPDAEAATHAWSDALEAVVHLLRSRDLEPARGSATIDTAASTEAR